MDIQAEIAERLFLKNQSAERSSDQVGEEGRVKIRNGEVFSHEVVMAKYQ